LDNRSVGAVIYGVKVTHIITVCAKAVTFMSQIVEHFDIEWEQLDYGTQQQFRNSVNLFVLDNFTSSSLAIVA
jgi:hypothetical protein